MTKQEGMIRQDEVLRILVLLEAANQAVPNETKNYAVDLITGFTEKVKIRFGQIRNEVGEEG